MSTPKRRPRSRALRPAAEALEPRQLLSSLIKGVDSRDGDRWSLRLIGPGTVRVTTQDGDDLRIPSQINTIRIAGTDLERSRLIGRVTPAPGGDGRVFFQNLRQTGGRALDPLDPNQTTGTQLISDGVLAVDLPNFWLGNTGGPPRTDPQTGEMLGSIEIPDGVITLRFGGVDTTFAPPGGTPLNTNGQDDVFQVDLGLPATRGTSIIVDRVVSGAQAAAPTTPPAPPGNQTQDTVNFMVEGRINLFQANAIEFQGNGVTADDVTTGTNVISTGQNQGITGQIGDLRIGGNATNLTVSVQGTTQDGNANARVSNFSVGGETQNVQLNAPGGSRNIFFGRGMDVVTINTLFISHLQANRGALNSTVTAQRAIKRVTIGGDVTNTTVLSGTLTTDTDQTADAGGRMTVRIAGDVVDSVFAASVDPSVDGDPGVFGDVVTLRDGRTKVNDVILPGGSIHAKVEGTIDNANNELVDPEAADQAFFADIVRVRPGVVVPPDVPEAPYPRGGGVAPNAPRVVRGLQPPRTRTPRTPGSTHRTGR